MATGSRLSWWRSSASTWLTHRPHRLLVGAIAALTLAAGLVLRLEHLAATEQEEQLRANLRQVCERTATFTAQRVRTFFGGAARDTIEGVGHPTYKRYELARITAAFDAGTNRYPYVDGFVFWSERFTGDLTRQVVFLRSPRSTAAGFRSASGDGLPLGVYATHDTLGPRLFAEAMAHAATSLGWAVTDVEVDGRRYQVVLHLLWEGGTRTRDGVFAVVGLIVDLTRVQAGVFRELFQSDQFDFLRGANALAITVRDEQGRLIQGVEVEDKAPMASTAVDALFFPSEGMERSTHITAATPAWTFVVSAAQRPPPSALRRSLSFGLLVLLMIALSCAVTVERQAMRLSRMQADFIANVTHQLKTPLALIAGAAETLALRRVSTPEKLSEYAEIVQSETERLTELVHSILDMSRVEARPQRLVCQSVDLSALVARTVDEFGKGLSGELTVRTEIPPEAVTILADPFAIEQVVLNLLDNAVRYGRHGNVVTIRVERRGGDAVVRVGDTGLGIHPSDIPHIFEKFYRGRNTRSDRRGFGLGLSIVDAIVRGHGGRIGVTSEVGSGSEFSVILRAAGA